LPPASNEACRYTGSSGAIANSNLPTEYLFLFYRAGDHPMNYTTNVGERGLAAEKTARVIASDKVEGTAVYDRNGSSLGRVHHLMIDTEAVEKTQRILLQH
jgi:hypothetical protein